MAERVYVAGTLAIVGIALLGLVGVPVYNWVANEINQINLPKFPPPITAEGEIAPYEHLIKIKTPPSSGPSILSSRPSSPCVVIDPTNPPDVQHDGRAPTAYSAWGELGNPPQVKYKGRVLNAPGDLPSLVYPGDTICLP